MCDVKNSGLFLDELATKKYAVFVAILMECFQIIRDFIYSVTYR